VDNSASGGLSLTTVLTIVFVILKLTHNIDWSWWWVLSPLWISFTLSLLIVIVVLAVRRHRRSY
jgi:hypothetical protein